MFSEQGFFLKKYKDFLLRKNLEGLKILGVEFFISRNIRKNFLRKYRIFFQSRFFLFFELGWKRVPGSLIIYFSSKKKIVRAITRGYGTAAKYLSIFVER